MEYENQKIYKKQKIKQVALQLQTVESSVFEYFISLKQERERLLEELIKSEGR